MIAVNARLVDLSFSATYQSNVLLTLLNSRPACQDFRVVHMLQCFGV